MPEQECSSNNFVPGTVDTGFPETTALSFASCSISVVPPISTYMLVSIRLSFLLPRLKHSMLVLRCSVRNIPRYCLSAVPLTVSCVCSVTKNKIGACRTPCCWIFLTVLSDVTNPGCATVSTTHCSRMLKAHCAVTTPESLPSLQTAFSQSRHQIFILVRKHMT